MRIATGNSRMDRKWKNKDISWEELKQKCSQTIRTTETVAEYRKMSKPAQDNTKDVGGFVGGALREGKRKNGYVDGRSLLTLDLDHAVPGIWDEITMFFDFKCMMYSTHKHTPEAPRVRLIIPLSREVTEDEYPAVSRMVGKDIGLDMIDDTCHQGARLMYWPSTSSDGEFLFESQDGPMLNPDDILNRYSDWRDSTQWPMSSRQSEIVKRSIAKQADPLEKEGIVGAFCRTYDIQAALDSYLTDIYQPSVMEGRYDYVPADSSAGLVLYDNKFCYSHHATDPAAGQLCNAFDIVRIHKFGHLDDRSKLDTAPSKLPSYKAMVDLAINDDNVKMQLAKERELAADQDFAEDDPNWQTRLEIDKNGNITDSLTNFVEIIRHDERLRQIAYNQHKCGIDVRDTEVLPWEQLKPGWSDADIASLSSYIDRVYHIYSQAKLKSALLTVTSERSFHPIKEFLEGLPDWDGKHRVDTLLIDYLGAEDNAYTRAVIRKALVAAVARVHEPGIKFDTILVLCGPQGIGKSMIFAKLGASWFSDSLSIADMRDKTGPEKLQGFWILEISEMNGIKKVDVETVKSFASRQDDKYRVAYGSVVESHPRQSVIFGTTNTTTGFLRDVTGNRRFWPVVVTGNCIKHPWDLNVAYLEQVWAEAYVLYNAGETLILEGEAAEIAKKNQLEALENDDREGLVRCYLDTLIPDNWTKMSLSDKRGFLAGDDFGVRPEGTTKRDKVCNLEIWAECFCKDPTTIKKQDSYEINAIMNKIGGWKRYEGNKSGKLSFAGYGSQVAYVRDNDVEAGENGS